MELKLNRQKCLQRNRIAATRDGVNGARMKFLRTLPKAETCARAIGSLPRSANEAMKLINANTKEPLRQEDVYIHYAEAANDNFLDDRYMWMHETTLRNIARAASAGIAFMNSHATGGLSAPAELPYGRTFAGRYEEVIRDDGSVRRRALFGFYMLRGVNPNGANGPSTDDLHAAIQGGTLFDVSVGLYGGQAICDVCGEDLEAECGHVPGSTHGMEQEQIDAQVARGVPAGRASYTLIGAKCHEVSAVYEGAVPGAGFTKALQHLRQLSDDERAELAESFQSLITGLQTFEVAMKKKDLEPMPEEEEKDEGLDSAPVDAAEEMPEDEKEESAPEDEEEPDDEEDPEGEGSPAEGEMPEDMPEDDEDEDEESAAMDEDEDDEDEETERIVSRVNALLQKVKAAAITEYKALVGRKFNAATVEVLAEMYGKAQIEEPISADDFLRLAEAAPDLESIFGGMPHVAAQIEEPTRRSTSTDIAAQVRARLADRGITLENTPSVAYNREYAQETQAIYRQMARK